MCYGLRTRTALLLVGLTLLVAALALLLGQRTLDQLRHELGAALVRDHARVAQQRIAGRVGLELALAERLAGATQVQQWLQADNQHVLPPRMATEMAGFRQAFSSHSYFMASEKRRQFYYADEHTGGELRHGYPIKRTNPENAWYFTTLNTASGHWINVDFDKTLGQTNVWINVAVRNAAGQALGVVGTGIDLSTFLQTVFGNSEPGITTMIVDRQGNVVAHPDPAHMQFDLAATTGSGKTIYQSLPPADAPLIHAELTRSDADENTLTTLTTHLDGQPRLLVIAHIPSLGWRVLTALDLEHGNLLSPARTSELLLIGGLLLTLLLLASSLGLDMLILRPLVRLTDSARRIAAGDYQVSLAGERHDEIGELSQAFNEMAQQVHRHSQHQEEQVATRTAALASAHKQLTASIRYARLIQHAILPPLTVDRDLGGESCALWLPRDVVGGDLYVYRHGQQGTLFGVIDCAGHGVPGACMTMITHAALEVALNACDWADPAALLAYLDQTIRQMLPQEALQPQAATSLDIGLCQIDPARTRLLFAGARVALTWHEDEQTHTIRGGRRALNDRKSPELSNHSVPLRPGQTFYLSSDGLLDQAGGEHGHAFGQGRLSTWIENHAHLPLATQRSRLIDTLETYRGEHGQRDDITLLAFRVMPLP